MPTTFHQCRCEKDDVHHEKQTIKLQGTYQILKENVAEFLKLKRCKVCNTCRSRTILQTGYLIFKCNIVFNIAENKPSKVWAMKAEVNNTVKKNSFAHSPVRNVGTCKVFSRHRSIRPAENGPSKIWVTKTLSPTLPGSNK